MKFWLCFITFLKLISELKSADETISTSTEALKPSFKLTSVFSNVVLLTAPPGLTCTGKIINPHWIISSGQCYRQFMRKGTEREDRPVYAMSVHCMGTTEAIRKFCKEKRIAARFLHPKYNEFKSSFSYPMPEVNSTFKSYCYDVSLYYMATPWSGIRYIPAFTPKYHKNDTMNVFRDIRAFFSSCQLTAFDMNNNLTRKSWSQRNSMLYESETLGARLITLVPSFSAVDVFNSGDLAHCGMKMYMQTYSINYTSVAFMRGSYNGAPLFCFSDKWYFTAILSTAYMQGISRASSIQFTRVDAIEDWVEAMVLGKPYS